MQLRLYRSLLGGGSPSAFLASASPSPFDGALLGLSQLLDAAASGAFASGSLLPAPRLLCQLDPRDGADAASQLLLLSDFLHSSSAPPLDCVVLRAPASSASLPAALDYLSAALPAAASFLESVPPGAVGRLAGGTDAHGGPLRPHAAGASHHLPLLNLCQLGEAADVFPPLRLALGAEVLAAAEGEGGALETTDGGGLGREVEAVVHGADVLRADAGCRPGIFGAGTLFGEVWSAQELSGAGETCVVCDGDGDREGGGGEVADLAARIRREFEDGKAWRAGAAERREEELRAARRGASWPEATKESARVLGIALPRKEGGRRKLTAAVVRRHWRARAFLSHPDTSREKAQDGLSFDNLRKHYLRLMEVVKREEEGEV